MSYMGVTKDMEDLSPTAIDLGIPLKVVNVIDESPGVKTFTFETHARQPVAYAAGQFVTLELPTASGRLLRTYTLSSSPSRPMLLSITAKLQPGGLGTQWMFDNLDVGSTVSALGPAGSFTLGRSQRTQYLFVSAGSGVTPMMSMLRWLHDTSPDADVSFVHCCRTPDDIIFRCEFEWLARQMPRLKLAFLVEMPSGRETWLGLTGRLDATRLNLFCPDFADREIFCCGPASFMEGVKSMLADLCFSSANYHEEQFTAAPAISGNTVPLSDEIQENGAKHEIIETVLLRFSESSVETVCTPNETVLNAARKAGVRILSVCEMGVCGTCKVRKISGEVQSEMSAGLTDEEVEQGYILACCSKPLSDLNIQA